MPQLPTAPKHSLRRNARWSIDAKEMLAIYYAFQEFGHIFSGTPKPVIILTDNKSVTRFFQTKIIPPPLWNAFTEEDNETDEQIWERKKQSKTGLKVPYTVIQIDAISGNNVDETKNFTQKWRRTNQIILEQSKDPILPQLKAQIQKVEYFEAILLQDIRFKHYLNNFDRIIIKDEVVTSQYYDET